MAPYKGHLFAPPWEVVSRRHKIIPDAEHAAFGAFLRLTREHLNVSQRELARRLSLPHSFIQKIEYGQRQVQVLELIAICRALNLSTPEVLATYERQAGSPVVTESP